MIEIHKGKTRRNVDIPCQTCGNPTSFQVSFAHNENPNAKTSIHICSSCIKQLQILLQAALDKSQKQTDNN